MAGQAEDQPVTRRSKGEDQSHRESNGTAKENQTEENQSQSSWGNVRNVTLAKCLVCLICGLVFGFAMEKGRIFEPRYVRNQMILGKFVMMKMFLSAVATGMFGMSLIAMLPLTHRQFISSSTTYFNGLCDNGILSSIVGGLLLGVGMSLAGSCPTSIFSQIGAGLQNVGYTFAGAVTGTLLYGMLKRYIDPLFRPYITESSNPWSGSPYFVLALPLVAMFAILVCAFEILLPWKTEVQMKVPDAPLLERKAWPPYISGMLIGSLQVPLILGIGQSLGGSSSVITMLSVLFVGPIRKLSPFIAKYKRGFGSWWQIFFVAGVIGGSYTSASWSNTFGTTKGVPPLYGFVGGMIMFFGTRIAGGCTSGHGVSGMGFLSIISFITVGAMFAGAVPTAILMNSFGTLKVI